MIFWGFIHGKIKKKQKQLRTMITTVAISHKSNSTVSFRKTSSQFFSLGNLLYPPPLPPPPPPLSLSIYIYIYIYIYCRFKGNFSFQQQFITVHFSLPILQTQPKSKECFYE